MRARKDSYKEVARDRKRGRMRKTERKRERERKDMRNSAFGTEQRRKDH